MVRTYTMFILLYFIFSSMSYCQPAVTDLYKRGIEALKEKNIPLAEQCFKESAGKEKDAASFYQLGNLQLEKDTYYSRNEALENLKQASLREPDNMKYRFQYLLLLEQFALNSAFHGYQEILNENPGNARALSRLGYYYLEDYNRYKNTTKIPDESSASFNLVDENETDRQKAEHCFMAALKSDSTLTEAYIGLCRLYESSGRNQKAIDVLHRIERKEPSNKEIHLYLGMLYNQIGKIRIAGEEFQKTLDLMTAAERDDFIYNSVKLLLSPICDFNKSLPKERIENLIEKFWVISNPLKIAEDNQRLLEHYSRMAYANLYFSVPEFRVTGWKTDRGEILIRYGLPKQMSKTVLSGVGAKIFWHYNDFMLVFENKYLSGNYILGNASACFMDNYKRIVFQSYDIKGKQFNIQNKIYNFKNLVEGPSGKYDSYLVFELPVRDSLGQLNKRISHFEAGIFVFDNDFNALSEKRIKSDEANIRNILKDKRNYYKTDYVKFNIPDGTVSFSFEIRKMIDSSFYSYNGSLLDPGIKMRGLDLSDPVLASDISADEEIKGALERKDIYIAPKIGKTLSGKEPVYLYYEVYDLLKGNDGLTDFEQIITLRKKEEDNDDGTLIGSISSGIKSLFGKKEVGMSLSASYKTKEVNPQQYLQLDLSKQPTGEYDLILEVKDKISGEKVERKLSIEITDGKK